MNYSESVHSPMLACPTLFTFSFFKSHWNSGEEFKELGTGVAVWDDQGPNFTGGALSLDGLSEDVLHHE